jgi:beta-lactamase superfamily II metal-dependent hydrolase
LAGEKLIVDFWDVGQGDCSVIRLPDQSLVIIDVGSRTSPLIDWLSERPRTIHSIILTHNDDDHAGCLPSLVKLPGISIGTVYLLLDRDKHHAQFEKIFRAVREEEKKGRFKVIGLDATREIWASDTKTFSLKAVYPSFSENTEAERPNETSAILCLTHGNKNAVVWPGDAPMQVLAEKCCGWTPTLLSGPHHGGPVDRKKSGFRGWVDALRPERLFVSVGTTRNYGLPYAAYLHQRASHGCHITCSQLTKQCDNEHINKDIPVLQTAGLLGLRAPRNGVPCRGCLRLTVTGTDVLMDPYDAEHWTRVQKLRRAQCLRR